MKNLKKIIFCSLIMVFVFSFCSCEALSDALKNAPEEAVLEDYEYSANGIVETDNVFQ